MLIDVLELPYFDLSDPQFSMDSAEVTAARDNGWCARTNLGFAVLRYDEVRALIKDPRLEQGGGAWLRQNGITQGLLADWWAENMLFVEGEDHRRLRRLVGPALSPRTIEPLAPGFRALAEELVASFAGQGQCEFLTEFAEPFSARAMTQVLGMPDGNWHDISRWSTDLMLAFGVTVAQDLERIEAGLAGLYTAVNELIESRRRQPGKDVVSELLTAHEVDERLNDAELKNLVSNLIFGGTDTTKDQLGLAMQLFVEHPDQWALLAQQPDLAANAVEEVLRFNPTVTWVPRVVVEDFEFKGVRFTPGTTIHLLDYTANTDPEAFEDAKFDITRKRLPHFTFGGGPHHCVGHFVARIELREALPVLARHMPDLRFASAPQFRPKSGVTGAVDLSLSFKPA
ncbi:cytochrome P450 [Sphingosinicella rhizophila]|uniref:Cytochrome P450 n=1 Tax=Sphingosinicella rhizophila TaxID=3050082 RepID=A0ABU3QC66_9SPHN|nr:cytochrome P450 [Sphingosinicella sp. GR2756]MDT9600535.1 cytochrome P450 [Sphingosinicella sp. GR2756]